MNYIDKFKNDLIDSIYLSYSKSGINYNPMCRDFRSVFITYISLLDRLIGPKKRRVHISKEIQNKISKENAESQRLKVLVEDMQRKFLNGDDVNGHLSKTIIKQIEKDDMLFDDWGISHLHLCTGFLDFFDLNRFMSSDLLFVIVLSDDVYFLQITNHGRDDFVDFDYLRIIKNNWESELLSEQDSIVSVSQSLNSPEDIKRVRAAGLNSFIHEIDGKYYFLKYARGYTTTKNSLRAVDSYIAFIKCLEQLDFNYHHLDFKEFTIEHLCTIFDDNGTSKELIYTKAR